MFNLLPKGEASNVFTVAVFSRKSFSGKTSFLVKDSYLSTFPHDKADQLARLKHIEICFAQLFYWLH